MNSGDRPPTLATYMEPETAETIAYSSDFMI